MRSRSLFLAVHSILAASVILAAANVPLSPAPASAATCQSWGVQPPYIGTGRSELRGVAVVSACSAWAVGWYTVGTSTKTLVEHWNGTTWKVVRSPSPGSTDNQLSGVAAISPRDAWAVGERRNGTSARTLIEHWNGHAWKVMRSPNVRSQFNTLAGIDGTSRTDIWVVGRHAKVENATPDRTLIERWNGNDWKIVHSPNPSVQADSLLSVAATTQRDVWAVGYIIRGSLTKTLIEHWNGRAWKVTDSPNVSIANNYLAGIALTSGKNGWAVGSFFDGATTRMLVEHWNGHTWKIAPSPNPGSFSSLSGIAAPSSDRAWAVGYYGTVQAQPLALRCC